MSYRVDNVPFYLKPLFWLYGYGLGVFLYVLVLLLRLTCRVKIEGEEIPGARTAVILCSWHQDIPSVFVVFQRLPQPQVWINHPPWHMKPVHVLLAWIGVKRLVLGSTGHDGQEAATRLVNYLKAGYSTVVLPDGPAGPPKQLKKGALHMAAQSGVPIMALRCSLSRSYIVNTWDKKRFPFPFSRITVTYSPLIFVDAQNLEEKSQQLAHALGA